MKYEICDDMAGIGIGGECGLSSSLSDSNDTFPGDYAESSRFSFISLMI